jgi:hypothetical protein
MTVYATGQPTVRLKDKTVVVVEGRTVMDVLPYVNPDEDYLLAIGDPGISAFWVASWAMVFKTLNIGVLNTHTAEYQWQTLHREDIRISFEKHRDAIELRRQAT